MTDEEARHSLLVRLRRIDAALVRHQAIVDVTEDEAADMRLDRLQRVVDAAEEHLAIVVELERAMTRPISRPPRHR